MRTLTPLLAVWLFLGGTAIAGDVSVEDLQRDVELRAWLTSKPTVIPGEPVRIGAKLVNRSGDATHPVVRPGDGSESGWREPHVFFTAVWRSPRDGHVPVEEKAWGRCGMYDPDWLRSVVTLGPGQELDLTMHLMAAHTFLDFQREGRTEIRLHYRWTGGKSHKGGPDAAEETGLGALEGVPPFELVSNPVIIEVKRPVEVTATLVGALRVGETRSLADLLAVQVRNRADEALEFSPQHLQFELAAPEPADLLGLREVVEPQARVRAARLRAGAERTFKGDTAFRLLRHLRLRAKKEGTLRLAVAYAPGAVARGSDRSPVRIRSPWVTFRVEPVSGKAASLRVTTIAYGGDDGRRFQIGEGGPGGLTLEDLPRALERHLEGHAGAQYEVKALVKVAPAEVERIQDAIQRAGARLVHFWVPVGDRLDEKGEAGPHGPGYVDLLE